MKLDYLEKYNEKYPDDTILRLWDFSQNEARELYGLVRKLLENGKDLSITDSLPFLTSGGISLLFSVAEEDHGLVLRDATSRRAFQCLLTRSTWQVVLHKIEPFVHGEMSGFTWLYDTDNPIDFLLSQSGQW